MSSHLGDHPIGGCDRGIGSKRVWRVVVVVCVCVCVCVVVVVVVVCVCVCVCVGGCVQLASRRLSLQPFVRPSTAHRQTPVL